MVARDTMIAGKDNLLISSTDSQICFTFKESATIRLTVCGGGGAGGIGCTLNYFYIYGAGGGAGAWNSRIVSVVKGEKWIIVIGKGGNSKEHSDGFTTTVYSCIEGSEVCVAKALGGSGGSPNLDQIHSVIDCNSLETASFNVKPLLEPGKTITENGEKAAKEGVAQPGEQGGVSYTARAGNGAATEKTGAPGKGGTAEIMCGTNGAWGSGGGGSQSHVIDIDVDKYSGSGGDGYCIIEWLNTTNDGLEHLINEFDGVCTC